LKSCHIWRSGGILYVLLLCQQLLGHADLLKQCQVSIVPTVILKGHPSNIYLWILKSLKNVSTRGWSGGVQPPLLHSPLDSSLATVIVSRLSFVSQKDIGTLPIKILIDNGWVWKQFFTCDRNNVNNGALPAEPLWENKTLSQIYLNSFIYCFFYNDIWLGYRNRMQIKSPPPAIFYLAFEALLLVYDRKRFVCSFFWAVCREQHCWLLLTSYQSLFMRTHCIRTRGTFFTGERIRQGRGGKLQLAWRKLLN
jgi:hypothetical protein